MYIKANRLWFELARGSSYRESTVLIKKKKKTGSSRYFVFFNVRDRPLELPLQVSAF